MWIGIQRNTNAAMRIGSKEMVPMRPGVAADHPLCAAVVKLESNSFAFSCYRTAR